MVKKSYVIDQENRLFLEVAWGKNKNGRAGFGTYFDYFSGKIVRIKPGVNIFEEHKKMKKANWEHEIGEIYGRSSKGVFFEEQQLFDVERDLPFQIQDYTPCLESDCRKREDIIMRKLNDYQRAQEAKESLEEIQRNDRKLRKEYSKKD